MRHASLDKGGRAEELLRKYFLRNGYFAARGVKVLHDGSEVTDIDLWLYLRPSTVSRIRVNVDAKYRASPKALERIFWAKGVQESLGFEQCVVATTDKRPAVKSLGEKHGVLVLDGWFLTRVQRSHEDTDRLTEEELLDLVTADGLDKLTGNWRSRFEAAKARLATRLEFDGCNLWLEDVRYFLEKSMLRDRREGACRLLYATLAFFLIGLDYSSRHIVLEDGEARKKDLLEGFRYGTRGRNRAEEALKTASGLISAYAPELRSVGERARSEALRDLGSIPLEILAEYFSRKEVSSELFHLARSMEEGAYAKPFRHPDRLDPALKGLIGAILDLHGVERKAFFESW